jgi:hypothetical protein
MSNTLIPKGKGEAWWATVVLPGPSRWAGGSFKVYAYNPDELRSTRLKSSLSERVRSRRDLSLRVNLDSSGPKCPRVVRSVPEGATAFLEIRSEVSPSGPKCPRGGTAFLEIRSLVHTNREPIAPL